MGTLTHAAAELHALAGGLLSEEECELILEPEATRAVVAEVKMALKEDRAVLVSEEDKNEYDQLSDEMRAILLDLPDLHTGTKGLESAETLKRQVAYLEASLAATTEQLAQAKHRRDRMGLLENATSRETAHSAYEQKLCEAIASEIEACTMAELECVDAITGLDTALLDLLARLDSRAPFLLSESGLDQLSDANSRFLAQVQAMMDGDGGSDEALDGEGLDAMRGMAMQEMRRLQDLFVSTELDRTDALQQQHEALAIQTTAQEQLDLLASGADLRALQTLQTSGTAVEDAVVAKRNEIARYACSVHTYNTRWGGEWGMEAGLPHT
jgi:hypothetical protein